MVSIRYAKAHFYELIARVELGESVVITKANKPVAILSPYHNQISKESNPLRRQPR